MGWKELLTKPLDPSYQTQERSIYNSPVESSENLGIQREMARFMGGVTPGREVVVYDSETLKRENDFLANIFRVGGAYWLYSHDVETKEQEIVDRIQKGLRRIGVSGPITTEFPTAPKVMATL